MGAIHGAAFMLPVAGGDLVRSWRNLFPASGAPAAENDNRADCILANSRETM